MPMQKLKKVLSVTASVIYLIGNSIVILLAFGFEFDWSLILSCIPLLFVLWNPVVLVLFLFWSLLHVLRRPFDALTIVYICFAASDLIYWSVSLILDRTGRKSKPSNRFHKIRSVFSKKTKH